MSRNLYFYGFFSANVNQLIILDLKFFRIHLRDIKLFKDL